MQDFGNRLAQLLAFLPIFYGACAVVQLTVIRPKTRYVVIGSFGTLAAMISLYGLLSFTVADVVSRQAGTLVLVIAGVTILPLMKSVRMLAGRFTPLDPKSTVDISGLIVALWALVIGGASAFTIDLATVASQVQITAASSIINVLALPALACCLVGIWITRSPREVVTRLGLERLGSRQIGIAVGLILPCLTLSVGFGVLGQIVAPERTAQVQEVLRAMSSNVTSPAIALFIALAAGVGEEIFFRGAIQPRLGIGLTALLFAVSHTQYGLSYAAVGVLVLGVILGYERKYLNTTACIITHTAYNFVAFLLPYLAATGAGSS